jgi:hypothetical protein
VTRGCRPGFFIVILKGNTLVEAWLMSCSGTDAKGCRMRWNAAAAHL